MEFSLQAALTPGRLKNSEQAEPPFVIFHWSFVIAKSKIHHVLARGESSWRLRGEIFLVRLGCSVVFVSPW